MCLPRILPQPGSGTSQFTGLDMAILGEFTPLYQAELEESTSPSQYTALQIKNGTLQTVGSRHREESDQARADGRNTSAFFMSKRLSWLTDTRSNAATLCSFLLVKNLRYCLACHCKAKMTIAST